MALFFAAAVAAGFLGELVGLLLVAEGGGHLVAFGEQQRGQRFAEAGGSAGDEPVFGGIGHGLVMQGVEIPSA